MKKVKFKAIILSIACLSVMTLMMGCDRDPDDTDPATVTDIDGNVYTTIRIGTQLWTVENLRTTRYNDGVLIPAGLSAADWENTTAGACTVYNDDNANHTTYGKLYNWHAVNTGKLAPAGWHVPTRAEWEILVEHLGGSTVAGGKLKSTSALWNAPNTGATNSSGFTGLPGGYRGVSGNYELMGESAYWWASSERNATQGDYLRVDDELAGTAINGATKQFGISVRLIMD